MLSFVIFDMFETLVSLATVQPYFGRDIALDLQIPVESFLVSWRNTENDRSCGRLTLEESITRIMNEYSCFSSEKLALVKRKRKDYKANSFRNLHKEILPMLAALKEEGCLLGLISNCFSEETELIHESSLFPFFDSPMLSFECGLKKPDKEIYRLCVEQLLKKKNQGGSVEEGFCPEDFLYVGDGGSRELETAASLSMRTGQACWYLKKDSFQPCTRKPEFQGFFSPMEVVEYVRNERR